MLIFLHKYFTPSTKRFHLVSWTDPAAGLWDPLTERLSWPILRLQACTTQAAFVSFSPLIGLRVHAFHCIGACLQSFPSKVDLINRLCRIWCFCMQDDTRIHLLRVVCSACCLFNSIIFSTRGPQEYMHFMPSVLHLYIFPSSVDCIDGLCRIWCFCRCSYGKLQDDARRDKNGNITIR